MFLDTVGLLATWDTRDQWHSAAEPTFRKLLAEGAVLFTTEFVLAECGNAAARKPYRPRVPVLRMKLQQRGRIVSLGDADVDAAWQDFGQRKPGQPGIVDLLSFKAMNLMGATEAFTNDQHFRAAGFITLF